MHYVLTLHTPEINEDTFDVPPNLIRTRWVEDFSMAASKEQKKRSTKKSRKEKKERESELEEDNGDISTDTLQRAACAKAFFEEKYKKIGVQTTEGLYNPLADRRNKLKELEKEKKRQKLRRNNGTVKLGDMLQKEREEDQTHKAHEEERRRQELQKKLQEEQERLRQIREEEALRKLREEEEAQKRFTEEQRKIQHQILKEEQERQEKLERRAQMQHNEPTSPKQVDASTEPQSTPPEKGPQSPPERRAQSPPERRPQSPERRVQFFGLTSNTRSLHIMID